MKITGEELQKRFSYEFENWKATSGFEPEALLATHDVAGPYEKNELHIFKLKRGYAIVSESGCSCYESSDAEIDLKPTLKDVKESLSNLAKSEYSQGDLARECLKQLTHKLRH